jgi:PPOX class probable F420-dependent enzyme
MGQNQRALITMTDEEVTTFLEQTRIATMATIGPTGMPHLVAMWYGLIDGKIYFETKLKSQKVKNLRRDPRIVVSAEGGHTYDQLRGVSIEGTAVFIEDPEDPEFWAAGVSVFERYNAPYTDEMKPFVEMMLNKRAIIRVEPTRVRSWDHRKLGGGAQPLGGTTAQYL